MPEYKCEKCGKKFYGWADNDTCQNCGGKLKPVKGLHGAN